jgi:hypothetical protein
MRYDVIALDEFGYVPLAEIGAEFLFDLLICRLCTGCLNLAQQSRSILSDHKDRESPPLLLGWLISNGSSLANCFSSDTKSPPQQNLWVHGGSGSRPSV